ncbi:MULTISPECIES: cobalamin B12-binding domain-containing protein [Streptomyces]|uniref:Cobalamin-dependent protein n=1 Tax=Streptomyces gilvifuscus TaxID=1550617 RepID=A0ABT5G3P6_9ACTN|nr:MULTISPECIES: cobalamin-dependent protein [Streptomyces]MBK3645682.1 cobalamin-dependent protein [Streptomyces sp. MBT33]MDC2959307.1 cobalamin-dependent protein [Streptomyces gilvifuscus]
MTQPAQSAPRDPSGPLDVVVTGLPSDAHTWNLVFMQLLLEDLGHHVVNLGPCIAQDEIVESCCKYQPDLLVVSSVNGHGFHDAEQLVRALRARWELAGLPAVVGGKLGVRGAEGRAGHRRLLLSAGFDAVFHDEEGLAPFKEFVTALAADRTPPVPAGAREGEAR